MHSSKHKLQERKNFTKKKNMISLKILNELEQENPEKNESLRAEQCFLHNRQGSDALLLCDELVARYEMKKQRY
jgi:hypothetical protein